MQNPYKFEVQYWDVPNRLDVKGASNPVSLQNRNGDKQLMMEALAKAVAENTTYIILGDVKVSITWIISPQERYGTHKVPDLDNIVKPILDAITGPQGVLVDDNQVQALDVGWQDLGEPGVKVEISINPQIDDRIAKGGLMFVEFPHRGCWPVTSEAHAKIVVPELTRRFEQAEKLTADGILPEVVSMYDPIQRFFPRARLGKFDVRPAKAFLDETTT